MTETIQTLKEDIAILQEKLQKLEELEKTKSPVEEAYKDWIGNYPPTGPSVDCIDDIRWRAFQMGYNAAYEEKVVEKKPEEQVSFIKELVKEGIKWCEEHPNESVEDWLKPQTHQQVADGLKKAFREAVKQGVVSSVDKPKDEEDENFKNSLDIIKEWGEKNKLTTLYDNKLTTLYDKLETWIDYGNFAQSKDVLVNEILNIVKSWLPPSSDKNSYEWEKCLKMIYGNLR